MTISIAFIGFGEAGQAFAASLRQTGAKLGAYDILLDEATPPADWHARATASGVRLNDSASAAIAEARLIISAVTADRALDAARDTAALMTPGQTLIDINSVAPSRKRAAAEAVDAAGAAYLDMAVMGPVHPRGHRTPVLIAGKNLEAVSPLLDTLGFSYAVAGRDAGAATAIKMVRSVFMKGFEAITAECLIAAQKAGVTDAVITSLADTYPGLDWSKLPGYQLERMARHGIRRAAEMREVCRTLEDLGLDPVMSRAAATAQQAVGDLDLVGAGVDLSDAEALIAAAAPALDRSRGPS